MQGAAVGRHEEAHWTIMMDLTEPREIQQRVNKAFTEKLTLMTGRALVWATAVWEQQSEHTCLCQRQHELVALADYHRMDPSASDNSSPEPFRTHSDGESTPDTCCSSAENHIP
ncbi:hypothetical protein DPEC_G00099410 [Dallia pectoralis]|uniref:Uncharacterized protein n=1 Tax=Dallia pectoralis TaxID=75939 RepID=A0ACC2GWU8_DALPE|nr:hypothetical protein DPEC_G00099410 [Dallia pectoralis]